MARRTPQPPTTTIPVGVVRTQLGKILTRVASTHERVVVTKKGQAAVVILSLEDYLQSLVQTPAELAAVQRAAKKSRADKLALPVIEAEVAAARQARTPQAA